MGYYTQYSLEIEYFNPPKNINSDELKTLVNQVLPLIESELSEISGYDVHLFEDTLKWYDHEEDTKKISKKYPDFLFKLKGHGEEAGDVWLKYFLNGKMQKAKITFEEFDPQKLN